MSANLIMCISKILTDLCLIKQKIKTRKYFCKCCLQCFSSEEILIEHRTDCSVINGKHSVQLKSGTIKVESDIIECDSNSSYTKRYQDHIPCSFAYKVGCIDNKFIKKVVLYRRKNAVYKFTKSILNEYNYCGKVIKKTFH